MREANCDYHWCTSTGNAVREDALSHVVAARGRTSKQEAWGGDNHTAGIMIGANPGQCRL